MTVAAIRASVIAGLEFGGEDVDSGVFGLPRESEVSDEVVESCFLSDGVEVRDVDDAGEA